MTESEAEAASGALLSRAKQGRERILGAIREAAIAEFSRHGFKGASTKAIAERAGLTKPQLHYYISSKEELYEELLYSVLNGWSGAFIFDSNSDDPKKVFSVKDGAIHVSGEGFGYIATKDEFRDYHLIVEYRWGKRTDGGKFVRNSGILLHATGPDGNAQVKEMKMGVRQA